MKEREKEYERFPPPPPQVFMWRKTGFGKLLFFFSFFHSLEYEFFCSVQLPSQCFLIWHFVAAQQWMPRYVCQWASPLFENENSTPDRITPPYGSPMHALHGIVVAGCCMLQLQTIQHWQHTRSSLAWTSNLGIARILLAQDCKGLILAINMYTRLMTTVQIETNFPRMTKSLAD